jgi:maleylacetate reductase
VTADSVGAGLAFVYDQRAVRVVFGAGRLGELAGEADRLGLGRVLLIASRYAAPAREALGRRVAGELTEPQPHVPLDQAREAVHRAAAVHADGIASVGGGSAIGLAKAVALETGIPVIAVPTTYSGSEMTRVW